jgi:hypothetical protein
MNSLLIEGVFMSRKKIVSPFIPIDPCPMGVISMSIPLGGAVAETLDADGGLIFKWVCVPDIFSYIAYPEYLYECYNTSKDGIKGGIEGVIAKT